MAGHSKWANIKHKKKEQDKRRGKLFSKLIRGITAAARQGDPDPETNPRLRLAVDKAYANNMQKDTIERAIKRAAGDEEAANLEEIRYEGYGPHGVAVMVDCMTDNRNRTVGDIRYAFSKAGGKLGTDNSVGFMFNRQGRVVVATDSDEETVLEAALESGAHDLQNNEDGTFSIITDPETVTDVRKQLVEEHWSVQSIEVTMQPTITAPINDLEQAQQVLRLFDQLDDLEDVQQVYSNVDINDEIWQQLEQDD